MSEAQVAAASPGPEPPQLQPTEAVRLRAPSPRIVRLSPKVLIGLSATSAAALFGLVLFALHMHGPHAPATNLVDAARPNPAEAVKNAAARLRGLASKRGCDGKRDAWSEWGSSCCRGSACGHAEARAGAARRSWPSHPERPGAGLGPDRQRVDPHHLRRPSRPRSTRCARSSLQERIAALTSPLFAGGDAAAPGAQPISLTDGAGGADCRVGSRARRVRHWALAQRRPRARSTSSPS